MWFSITLFQCLICSLYSFSDVQKEGIKFSTSPNESSVYHDSKFYNESEKLHLEGGTLERPTNKAYGSINSQSFEDKKQLPSGEVTHKPTSSNKKLNNSEELDSVANISKKLDKGESVLKTSTNMALNSTSVTETIINRFTANQTEKLNTTKEPKHLKPTVLSYEALQNKQSLKDVTIPYNKKELLQTKTISKTTHQEQNKDVKKERLDHTPAMITPIVITILVVPIFAVLGYMALKHGKEAWKNRHYKRVDFLLDGMYND